jgi:hypothetical protein
MQATRQIGEMPMTKAIIATVLYALAALPLGAQDTTRIKIQTDSIRKETCRGGRLSASGLTCSGATSTPRVSVIRRLANRVDSLLRVGQPAPVPTPTPTPIPEPTPTPTPNPIPSGVAELPRVVPASRDPYPGRLCSINVPDGLTIAGNLNSALASARGGQVVCSVGTHTKVRLPARAVGDTGTIVLRQSGLSWPEGSRMTPSGGGNLLTIRTTDSECALTTAPGTHGWYLAGIRFTTTAPMTYQIVCLGNAGADQDAMSEAPQRLVISRSIVDGGTAQVQRCVGLNAGATAIVDSWLMNCHIKGFEGHGIGGWNGPGPHLVENNTIEAAGINVLIGGSTPSIPNLRTADVTIRRNHLIKPLAWGPPGTGLGPWTEKNLLELKNATRVLISENYLENSWQDAQPTGSGIMLKSINDEGVCTWCQTTDVTIRRNYGKNIETPFVLSAAENYNDPSKPPPPLLRIAISENVFDDAGAVAWGAKAVQMTTGHAVTAAQSGADILVERNVIAQGAGKTIANALLVNAPGYARAVFRDNVWPHGLYSVLNGEGLFGDAALQAGAPGAVWSGMCFVKSANHEGGTAPPTGTQIVTTESQCPVAAQVRSTVTAAVAGVVVSP